MSLPSGVSIAEDCIAAFGRLRSSRHIDKPMFIIYKITEDYKNVEVEESSSEGNYEIFHQRLVSAVDSAGQPAPRYAVYDVEYDLGPEGKRTKIVFLTWVPEGTSVKDRMVYASTKEQLRHFLGVKLSIHADDVAELKWKSILEKVGA